MVDGPISSKHDGHGRWQDGLSLIVLAVRVGLREKEPRTVSCPVIQQAVTSEGIEANEGTLAKLTSTKTGRRSLNQKGTPGGQSGICRGSLKQGSFGFRAQAGHRKCAGNNRGLGDLA